MHKTKISKVMMSIVRPDFSAFILALSFFFWLFAAFSKSNLGKVYINGFFKACIYFDYRFRPFWAASKKLEHDECPKVRSDYVRLYFSFILIFLPNLFYTQ